MKSKNDFSTVEIPGLKRPPGRPPTGKAMTSAERVRRHRERMGVTKVSVDLTTELVARLDEFAEFRDEPKRDIIERLLRNQLMRKR